MYGRYASQNWNQAKRSKSAMDEKIIYVKIDSFRVVIWRVITKSFYEF